MPSQRKKYNPVCECCHGRPKMDRCDCCDECWYSGRYSAMRDRDDERSAWYTDALDRERLDQAYRELDGVLDV